jgi:hypothetical protein
MKFVIPKGVTLKKINLKLLTEDLRILKLLGLTREQIGYRGSDNNNHTFLVRTDKKSIEGYITHDSIDKSTNIPNHPIGHIGNDPLMSYFCSTPRFVIVKNLRNSVNLTKEVILKEKKIISNIRQALKNPRTTVKLGIIPEYQKAMRKIEAAKIPKSDQITVLKTDKQPRVPYRVPKSNLPKTNRVRLSRISRRKDVEQFTQPPDVGDLV